MKRAEQATRVSRALVRDHGNPFLLVDLPPEPWFVRGPRGGVYVATDERERFVTETGDDWMQNMVTVIDRSRGIRYVRPGSPLHREWEATR